MEASKLNNSNQLIKVDYNDVPIGIGSKEELHIKPIMHRAFSVFIYHDGKMFIHQRKDNKYHSGGLWTNACCSHFREGMDEVQCVNDRLNFELGINEEPQYLTKFVYYHKFSDVMYEFEYDHVYVLDYNGSFAVNNDEIQDTKWVDIELLSKDIVLHPERYSVWFITAFGYVYEYLKNKE